MPPDNIPILVTCGLPYANGPAHIGHLRTYIPADIYVRALRKMGREVVFVCGSDAHGTPIVVNAEGLGLTPRELVDRYHCHFQEVFQGMNVHFDYFGNTDDPTNHHRTQAIVTDLMNGDYVYPRDIELAYCPSCTRFLPDRYVEGICPYCGSPARGDECDQGCGRHLEPGEIQEAICKVCGSRAEYRSQTHYFFRLSAFRDFLLDYLEGLGGTTSARNYASEWVRQELKDWCITRNMSWGVKFPGRDDLVVYVWVDAPIGYISFTEEWAARMGTSWERYWKGNSRIVHFIGGDIVYHHCIFWPAMLKGAGYTLPSDVVASGMLKIDDKKFSKSRGYVVWVMEDYLERGLHPDLLRYYLASYTSHTKEVNFSWKIFAEKINSELVGAFGNFINRALTFAVKNFEGAIPNGDIDPEVMKKIDDTSLEVKEALMAYEFKKACDMVMALADFGNSYFQAREPWKLVKIDATAAGAAVRTCLQIAKAMVILMDPVMPAKMGQAWKQLGLAGGVAGFKEVSVPLPPGSPLGHPEILFLRLEEETVADLDEIFQGRIRQAAEKGGETGKRGTSAAETEPEMAKTAMARASSGTNAVAFDETPPQEGDLQDTGPRTIPYTEFQALDLRIGVIIAAESIKKSDKLLRLQVDLGTERRQVVAGVAKAYSPESLLGRRIVMVANLQPTKLFGVESQGMLLAADVEGSPVLLTPDKEVDPGTPVR